MISNFLRVFSGSVPHPEQMGVVLGHDAGIRGKGSNGEGFCQGFCRVNSASGDGFSMSCPS